MLQELELAWKQNNAIQKFVLEMCADEDFDLKPTLGKTIRSNFVHVISVRGFWAEETLRKAKPDIPKLDWKSATREEIVHGLDESSAAFLEILRKKHAQGKPLGTFFAYAIAHESHHRSQIELTLRIHKRAPDDMTLMRIWEWKKFGQSEDSEETGN